MRRLLGYGIAAVALRIYYLPALLYALADAVAGEDTMARWFPPNGEEAPAREREEAVA